MYYLWLKQRGEGCDYTIGCGQTIEPLHNVTPEDGDKFTKRIKNKIKSYGDLIESAVVFKRVGDAKKIIDEVEKEQEKAEEKALRESKLAEYNRLKRELGL